jgi:hypothetical protein
LRAALTTVFPCESRSVLLGRDGFYFTGAQRRGL